MDIQITTHGETITLYGRTYTWEFFRLLGQGLPEDQIFEIRTLGEGCSIIRTDRGRIDKKS